MRKIIKKILRRELIRSCFGAKRRSAGRALLYYKTDYFALGKILEDRSHTNEWESFEIARILDRMGFKVDVLDRSASIDKIRSLKDEYKIFIGIGAGDSGKHYDLIAKKLQSAVRIFYALGPEPNLSNVLTQARHEYFERRHPGSNILVRRLIKDVDIEEAMNNSEAIITCCNEWGVAGYKKFGKQIERVWLSSYPALSSDLSVILSKKKNKFLYFGGNGNITKGLDLTVEVFAGIPELELYIGAPTSENDFNTVIMPIVKKASNIHFLGFLDVKGREFKEVSDECGYVILPSSSEGCATSVTTCMRKAAIPVVSRETGVDVGDFGHIIEDVSIEGISNSLRRISNESEGNFIRRSIGAYIESTKYTRDNFSSSFEYALLNIIKKNLNKYEKQNNS